MVARAGAADGVDRLRALNRPRRVSVRSDSQGLPTAVRLRAGWVAVERVIDHWRLEDEWWREEPLRRWYYGLALAGGRTLTVFHDRSRDTWFQQADGGHA